MNNSSAPSLHLPSLQNSRQFLFIQNKVRKCRSLVHRQKKAKELTIFLTNLLPIQKENQEISTLWKCQEGTSEPHYVFFHGLTTQGRYFRLRKHAHVSPTSNKNSKSWQQVLCCSELLLAAPLLQHDSDAWQDWNWISIHILFPTQTLVGVQESHRCYSASFSVPVPKYVGDCPC